MIGSNTAPTVKQEAEAGQRVGTFGYLALLGWSLALMLLTPASHVLVAAALCLTGAALFYPQAFRRLMRVRWLLLLLAMGLPPLFFGGEPYVTVWGVAVSAAGLQAGLQMVLRALVILISVDGFSGAVDVSETAALFERSGLRGLGFSVGVAMNLLPILRHSFTATWHSLRMRGGFRKQRLHSLQLLLVTVVSNALRRAEEIALAAETRAFSPAHIYVPPLKTGAWDWLIIAAGLCAFLALHIIPL